jgi:hypothetical protein
LWSNGAEDVVSSFLEDLQQPQPEASVGTSPKGQYSQHKKEKGRGDRTDDESVTGSHVDRLRKQF